MNFMEEYTSSGRSSRERWRSVEEEQHSLRNHPFTTPDARAMANDRFVPVKPRPPNTDDTSLDSVPSTVDMPRRHAVPPTFTGFVRSTERPSNEDPAAMVDVGILEYRDKCQKDFYGKKIRSLQEDKNSLQQRLERTEERELALQRELESEKAKSSWLGGLLCEERRWRDDHPQQDSMGIPSTTEEESVPEELHQLLHKMLQPTNAGGVTDLLRETGHCNEDSSSTVSQSKEGKASEVTMADVVFQLQEVKDQLAANGKKRRRSSKGRRKKRSKTEQDPSRAWCTIM